MFNLIGRFLLEVFAYLSMALLGFFLTDSILRWGFAIFIPVTLAIPWTYINVPGDPAREGKALIPVPGIIRLLIELLYFSFGVFASYYVMGEIVAFIFFGLLAVHYLISYDRVLWLLKTNKIRINE